MLINDLYLCAYTHTHMHTHTIPYMQTFISREIYCSIKKEINELSLKELNIAIWVNSEGHEDF